MTTTSYEPLTQQEEIVLETVALLCNVSVACENPVADSCTDFTSGDYLLRVFMCDTGNAYKVKICEASFEDDGFLDDLSEGIFVFGHQTRYASLDNTSKAPMIALLSAICVSKGKTVPQPNSKIVHLSDYRGKK